MDRVLTRRQADLRAAAVAALAGLALVQVVQLPYGVAQARHLGVLSGLLAAAFVALAIAVAAARAASGGAVWRAVAAAGSLVAGGWVATRLVAIPGSTGAIGRWTTVPGLASAGLGAACAALACRGSGARLSRAALATLAKAAVLIAALAPATCVLLVALGPGPAGGESTIAGAAGGHSHVHVDIAPGFRPGFGGHSGHYIYPNATPPQLPAWALALAVAAAALFVYVVAGVLRGRCAEASESPSPGRSISAGAAPRALATILLLLVVLAAVTSTASAHATLLRSVPPAATHQTTMPAVVRLEFSEPVQILRSSDVSVVDGRGRAVTAAAPRVDPADPRAVMLALRRELQPDSYTVRYRVISDDSHGIDDALVFALGQGRLRPPVLRVAGGVSETSPWAVGARFTELTALGLLLGLIAFRQFVWGPALRARRELDARERDAALVGGARLYWRAFWACAGVAGLAEASVLAAKSAVVFHTGIGPALTDPGAAMRLVAASRFGDLLGWRSALLLVIVTVSFWEWAREGACARRGAGRLVPTTLIGAMSAGALAMLSVQGHASQAPLAPLSVLADAIHLSAAGVWIGGLPCLAAVLLRAPAALPDGGRRLAAAVASRFSRLALVAVVLIVVTGAARAAGELSGVGELWSTDYGLSLALKALLLCPLVFLGARNRRTLAANGAGALRALRRNVRTEVVIALNIVAIAALLVAQIPGRDAPTLAPPPPAVRAATPAPPPGPDGFSRRPAAAAPGNPRG